MEVKIASSDLVIPILLESNTIIPGSCIDATYDPTIVAIEAIVNNSDLNVSTYDQIIEHFKHGIFVTGTTDSKFDLIIKYADKTSVSLFSENRTMIKFDLPGLNSSAMILKETLDGIGNEYVLYLDTQNPIKYIDLDNGMSIFTYKKTNIDEANLPYVVYFEGIVEEPKIVSEVFIDRGLNSAFEKIKRLKNVRDINELTKIGLGFYKINKKGYNFKNI